jgi:SAM-dependent methyltransferase
MSGMPSRLVDRWDAVADSYGSSPVIARLARGLADLVGTARGEPVLDVGTGTGLALIPAARSSGTGSALGVDRSLGMLQAAAERIAEAGLSGCPLAQADALQLPVRDGSFGVVLAASVWQFVGYSPAALAEWRRVLRPGGRLGLSVPGPGSGASLPGDLRDKYFSHLDRTAQADFISRAASAHPLPDLAEAVLAAGFDDAKVLERSWTDTLASPEEWWAIQWTHAVRFFLQALDPEALSALKSEALDRLDHADDGGVTVTTKVIYCVARC